MNTPWIGFLSKDPWTIGTLHPRPPAPYVDPPLLPLSHPHLPYLPHLSTPPPTLPHLSDPPPPAKRLETTVSNPFIHSYSIKGCAKRFTSYTLMSKLAKRFDPSIELWTLLPLEILIKITEHFVGHSQLRLFRSLCKQTSTMTTPLHERSVRIRDQIQVYMDMVTDKAALFSRHKNTHLMCSCRFNNTIPAQIEIKEFACNNWMCRKKLLPTPEPPLMETQGMSGMDMKPGSIILTTNVQRNMFNKYHKMQYRWRCRHPESKEYSAWTMCPNLGDPFLTCRRSNLNPDMLYSFSIRVRSDQCVSEWSEAGEDVHPLTQSECNALDGREDGYFAL